MLLGPLPSRFYFSCSVNKQRLPASRFLFCPGRAEQGVGRQRPFSLPPPLLQSRAPPGWSSSGVPRGVSPAPGAETPQRQRGPGADEAPLAPPAASPPPHESRLQCWGPGLSALGKHSRAVITEPPSWRLFPRSIINELPAALTLKHSWWQGMGLPGGATSVLWGWILPKHCSGHGEPKGMCGDRVCGPQTPVEHRCCPIVLGGARWLCQGARWKQGSFFF